MNQFHDAEFENSNSYDVGRFVTSALARETIETAIEALKNATEDHRYQRENELLKALSGYGRAIMDVKEPTAQIADEKKVRLEYSRRLLDDPEWAQVCEIIDTSLSYSPDDRPTAHERPMNFSRASLGSSRISGRKLRICRAFLEE
jgi:hypothetical protein